MIKNIKINNLTHKVIMNKNERFIGIKGENKFETLKFTFEDEFLNGEGILEIQKPNSQKEYIILDKEEDCYLLEVKNSLLTLEGEITMQLVVRLPNNKVFKSVEFTMQVLKAIEATAEIPDEYETWDSTLAAKILEIDSKLEEVTALEQDLEEKVQSGYFKGEKGDTGEPGQNGAKGTDGFSPTVQTQTVENGVQVAITDANSFHTFTILNGKDGEIDEEAISLAVTEYLDTHSIVVPTKTSDLTNDSDFVSDSNYVHTDNNFTNTYKEKVDSNTSVRHTHTNKQVLDNITSNDISNWNNKSDFSGSYNDLSNKPTIPSEVTESTVSNWGFTKNTGTYSKPTGGIPKTDLESAVQTSLEKADTALQAHQDISGKQNITDNSLTTINKTIPTAINEVNSIAKGANQALSYSNYQSMITAFNALANNVYNVGQNVMIVTLNVPDLWISSIESTSQTYTYTTDDAFTTALATNGYVQVGCYKLSALETQKVDLTDYARTQDIPANLSDLNDDSTHRLVTDAEKNIWNNKSNFSGNYNDLTNKPTNVSAFTNDAGYLTQHQDITGKLDTSKVKNTQSTTAGDVYDVRYINSVLGDIETLLQGV